MNFKEFSVVLRADNDIIVLTTNHLNGVPLGKFVVIEIDPQLVFNTDHVSVHSYHDDQLDALDQAMIIYDEIELAVAEATENPVKS